MTAAEKSTRVTREEERADIDDRPAGEKVRSTNMRMITYDNFGIVPSPKIGVQPRIVRYGTRGADSNIRHAHDLDR
jgi:hypothetical protein